MFWLKKLLSAGLQPCSLLLVVIGVGLLLLRFTRQHRAGKILLLTGLGGWLLFSLAPLANALARPLENAYSPLLPHASEPRTTLPDGSAAPTWIVILGGGNLDEPALAPLQQLAPGSVARLTEGLRLLRLFPGAKLLLSGGPVHSRLLAGGAISLGVTQDRMASLPNVLDTEDEARALSALLGPERFVLVTSATHMPRAMALCRKRGLRPLAAPTDYAGNDETWSTRHLLDLIPRAGAGALIERCLHEYLGLLWAKLRGQA